MIENVSSKFHALIKKSPFEAVNFRKVFESELFGLAFKEVSFFSFSFLVTYISNLIS